MNSMKIVAGAFVFTCNDKKDFGFLNVAVRSNLVVELSRDLDSLKRKYPEAEVVERAREDRAAHFL